MPIRDSSKFWKYLDSTALLILLYLSWLRSNSTSIPPIYLKSLHWEQSGYWFFQDGQYAWKELGFLKQHKIGLHDHLFAGQNFKIQKIFFENRGKNSLSSPQFVIEPTSNLIVSAEAIQFFVERTERSKSPIFKSVDKSSCIPVKTGSSLQSRIALWWIAF